MRIFLNFWNFLEIKRINSTKVIKSRIQKISDVGSMKDMVYQSLNAESRNFNVNGLLFRIGGEHSAKKLNFLDTTNN